MKFLVITLAPTLSKDERLYSYAPYVKEMDIWFEQVDEVVIASPVTYNGPLLKQAFRRSDIKVAALPAIEFNTLGSSFYALLNLPLVFFRLWKEMKKADHIHLRCPGTIALVGCIVQIFFPKKPKTAKYAGNWDMKSRQPLSYRIQKWILANTGLTKNMKVLVYGEWPDSSRNIKSFFTASYPEEKKRGVIDRNFSQPFSFMFAGSLSPGKQPLYAVKLIERLNSEGLSCRLSIYGDGAMGSELEQYIADRSLQQYVKMYGNRPSEEIEAAYKQTDFLILASRSEGWPKVVAESMFWGCIPIVTPVSCVPWMLGDGKRGILISGNVEADVALVKTSLENTYELKRMSEAGQKWSQQYTLDSFEEEIIKLLR